MPIDSVVGLLVAISDLKAVRAVTRAINANLPKDGPLGTIRPSSAQLYARPRQYYTPTPQPYVLPRPVVEPTPLRAPGADYYDPTQRDRPVPPAVVPFVETIDPGSCDHSRRYSAGPFDAPWKHLPPVDRIETRMEVNPVRPKVELITKGTLLDLYC